MGGVLSGFCGSTFLSLTGVRPIPFLPIFSCVSERFPGVKSKINDVVEVRENMIRMKKRNKKKTKIEQDLVGRLRQ